MEKLKQETIRCAGQLLSSRLSNLQQQIMDLTDSLANETKSSVGDKHETARARMQSEQEKLEGQLAQVRQQLHELHKLEQLPSGTRVLPGSLVETSRGHFFIGPALGKIRALDQEVVLISLQSPLGLLLSGKTAGESFQLNALNYHIKSVQ